MGRICLIGSDQKSSAPFKRNRQYGGPCDRETIGVSRRTKTVSVKDDHLFSCLKAE
ncbi:hypothetical protein DWB64_09470 [Fusibacter sp. A1]|nr:hypothetical protein DWB64_09470 [Fusibacter sp. A1]